MRKKILFVIDSLGCGGAEKSLVSLLPLLDHNKYDIDLMMISRGGVLEQYIPKEVTIIDYKPHNGSLIDKTIYRLFQIIFSIKLRIFNLIGIKRYMGELQWGVMRYAIKKHYNEYDLAVAYHQGVPTYYVASKVNAKKKIAWINADMHNAGYRIKVNQKYYNLYDHVVPVSTMLKNIIAPHYLKDETTVIYDIINPDLIKKMSEEKTSSQHKGLSLTTVARLHPLKGHMLAIEAAKVLKSKKIDFIWYFVGDGPYRNEIEHAIRKYELGQNIILLGMQSNPYPYMKMCDIYVQPSLAEGYGITIGEAKILHKPIVSTNFPIVYDQLTDEQNGLIVNMTGEDIANGILRLISDCDLKKRLVENLKCESNLSSISEPQKVMSLFEN